MKRLIFILFSIIIVGCSNNYKKSDLLGNWDCISITDVETGEISLPEGDDKFLAEFRSDSLYLSTEEVYAWHIKGDSIFLNEGLSVFIKELTPSSLTVELDIFGEQRLKFKKIK